MWWCPACYSCPGTLQVLWSKVCTTVLRNNLKWSWFENFLLHKCWTRNDCTWAWTVLNARSSDWLTDFHHISLTYFPAKRKPINCGVPGKPTLMLNLCLLQTSRPKVDELHQLRKIQVCISKPAIFLHLGVHLMSSGLDGSPTTPLPPLTWSFGRGWHDQIHVSITGLYMTSSCQWCPHPSGNWWFVYGMTVQLSAVSCRSSYLLWWRPCCSWVSTHPQQ